MRSSAVSGLVGAMVTLVGSVGGVFVKLTTTFMLLPGVESTLICCTRVVAYWLSRVVGNILWAKPAALLYALVWLRVATPSERKAAEAFSSYSFAVV